MPQHHERRVLPFAPDQLFELVSDVRSYPRFLPWVSALRVLEDGTEAGAGTMTAEMAVGYKAFRETMRCRVRLDRADRAIHVDYLRGPLRRLVNDWRFEPVPGRADATLVDFRVDFEFRSRIMAVAARALLDKGVLRLVEAFEAEASRRYGGPAHIENRQ